MKYWRSYLTTGGYRYARTSNGVGERLTADHTVWVHVDGLGSEIEFTGTWDPASPEEVAMLVELVSTPAA